MNAPAPWLSVVMPTHEGERWLGAALDSLVAQDMSGVEVILFDSSAGDACLDVAARYQDRLDLRAESRRDLGPWTIKTNEAIAQARAPFVTMLHQDDVWQAGRVAKLRQWIARWPDATMFLHPAAIIDGEGRKLGLWRCPLPDGPAPPQMLLSRLIVQNFIAIPTPVFRRDAFLAVGGMDPALWYTADWDLYLKLARAGVVVHQSDVLAAFRIHDGSQTIKGSRSADDFRAQMRIVLDRHAAFVIGDDRAAALKAAAASIAINTGLAAASHGDRAALLPALVCALRLGPFGLARYLRDSRLAERLAPRLRARLAGGL